MKTSKFFPACLIALGTLYAVSSTAQDAAKEPSRREAHEIVVPQCRIKLIDQVVLASDRVGILDFVESREGDHVDKGKAIAGLRDDVPRAAYAIAEHEATNDVEIRFAKKASDVAWVEYDKAVETNKRAPGAVPEVEVLRLKLTAEKSVLQAEQAEREFKKNALTRDQAAAELKSFQILAPFDGIVTRVYKYSGEAVQQGDPIVEFVNPDRLRIEGFVDVNEVAGLTVNRRVQVQLEIPGEKPTLSPEVLEGRITFVDVSVQPVGGKIRIFAEVTNRDGLLRAGQTAQMIIKADNGASAAKAAAEKK